MIDLHAHILAGLDDGPADLDESLAMCRIAANDGIRSVVATPHTGNGVYNNHRNAIISSLSLLQNEIDKAQLPIVLFPGADVHANVDITAMLDDGRAMTVNDNGRYVMIEIPDQTVPPNFEEWLFGMRLKGITPILTHPERNVAIRSDIDLLAKIVTMGVLVQVTAMGITGHFGDAVAKASLDMLERGLVHVIATDAHSSNGRPPVLSAARNVAASLLGEEEAWLLVQKNPRSILEGQPVEIPKRSQKKPGFMKKFLSWDRAV